MLSNLDEFRDFFMPTCLHLKRDVPVSSISQRIAVFCFSPFYPVSISGAQLKAERKWANLGDLCDSAVN